MADFARAGAAAIWSRDGIENAERGIYTRYIIVPVKDWHEKKNGRVHMSADGVRLLYRTRNVFIHNSPPRCRKQGSYIFRVSCIRALHHRDNENPYVRKIAIGHVPIKIQKRHGVTLKLPVKSAFPRPPQRIFYIFWCHAFSRTEMFLCILRAKCGFLLRGVSLPSEKLGSNETF